MDDFDGTMHGLITKFSFVSSLNAVLPSSLLARTILDEQSNVIAITKKVFLC
jgi:hypothetical protein